MKFLDIFRQKRRDSTSFKFGRSALLSYSVFQKIDIPKLIEYEKEFRRNKSWLGPDYAECRVKEWSRFRKAFLSLSPFNHGQPSKMLLCTNDSGAIIFFNNQQIPGGGVNMSHPASALTGCLGMGIMYALEPKWNYLCDIREGRKLIRGIRSKDCGEGEVQYANACDPLPFEDVSVFKSLKRAKPIGVEKIRKFTEYFGFPIPIDSTFPDHLKDIVLVEFKKVLRFSPSEKAISKKMLALPDYKSKS